jgi:hypothetical protein
VRIPSYVDEPNEILQQMVPALSKMKFDAGQNATDRSATLATQDKIAFIMSHTGAVIEDLLHRVPNLIAKEEVKQATDATSVAALAVPSFGPTMDTQYQRVQHYSTHVYSYRIVPKPGSEGVNSFDEFRTDNHDHLIDNSNRKMENPHSVGFATTWLFFLPGNIEESKFRYLGEQTIGKRKAYALAFAQIPEKTRLDPVIDSSYGRCSTSIQGIAWIDESTFRIARIQTDLLSPLPAMQLNQLSSVVDYS